MLACSTIRHLRLVRPTKTCKRKLVISRAAGSKANFPSENAANDASRGHRQPAEIHRDMGDFPHKFTDDDRRKAAETKRERAKTFRQRLAEKLDDRADELIDAAMQAAASGDWRATVALLEQAYGKAPASLDVTTDGASFVTEDRSASLADVAAVLKAAGALDGLNLSQDVGGEVAGAADVLSDPQ